jgi:putative ABC transport system permease protein
MVRAEFFLQQLSEVPFSNYRWDYYKPKSKDFLYMLQWVGVLSLVIAWVNYIKLSVSSYLKRLREIGVRKTNGAGFRDFVIQFATESTITNLLSILLAFTIVQLVKSPIEILFGFYVLPWKVLPLSGFIISTLALVVGILITCMVPLLLYSGYSSLSLFRGRVKRSEGIQWSNGLVVVQFCFSIVLIVLVFIVYAQVDFVLNADYGLNRAEVAVVDLPLVRDEAFESNLAVAIEKINATSGISGVTAFTTITGDAENNMICIKKSAANNDACVDTSGGIDENFLPFFGIHLLAGRNFQTDLPADSSTVILSRKAIIRIGFNSPEEAIGSRILVNTGTWTTANFQYAEVIGVIEDYKVGNQSFLNDQAIGDGIILTYKDRFVPSAKFQKIAVGLRANQFEVINKRIKDIYSQIFPDQPFRFYFLDEQIASFYDREKTACNQILLFSLIAIGITCLGLLGMISNKALEKTKEIGIRKVLGARLDQIARLLLIPTAWQILIAMTVGIPVSLYLVQQYLQKFSEHIQLHWWHFALPAMVLVIIMFATIASVLWKAGNNNPVEALKNE